MKPAWPVVVVGLGAAGAATLWQLAQRGVPALGLDRWQPPHPHGSTHGQTRITRQAIGEGSEYVPLAQRSQQLWRQLEQHSGRDLFHTCGVLVVAPEDHAFLRQTRASARAYGIQHEDWDAQQCRQRFPALQPAPGEQTYWEPGGGWVRPEAAVEVQLQLASQHGADIQTGEVVDWQTGGGLVQLQLRDGRRLQAEQLVLCAGAWLPQLSRLPDAGQLFRVYHQSLHWLEITGDYDRLAELPVWIWEDHAPRSSYQHSSGFYGFPALDGPGGGIKLASESYGYPVDPQALPDPRPMLRAEAQRLQEQVLPRLQHVGPRVLRSVACLYTCTPGSRFLVDRHPDCPQTWLVSACSGHGFKHSAALGEALAQQLVGGSSEIDLGSFALDRLRASLEQAGANP